MENQECLGQGHNILLEAYHKRLRTVIEPIELVGVLKELNVPRPNGIPFIIYGRLSTIAAPLFLSVIRALEAGRTPPEGFNHCNIFFLPKDQTFLPKKTRPIAASNTDNRLIASIVRAKLQDPILEILSKAQTGFVKGRSIEEHIRQFNRRFYRAVGNHRKQCHILFLDFAKAFDSVQRTYLAHLLNHIGVPPTTWRLSTACFTT